ncbi:MAG: DUF3747 domain-containing protein [Microcystis wesenbergii Mw_QC_S_20081001_S30D]|jgi:hypothetical protein|uniref:DUF3747 domain-containing protein n=1 Tax=Microcystis wesenbergii Mw_QC_S_20081001_S30D TaxID=2486245 RepID=A0A552JFV5_9CHRO|nr:DUF3747 domain-containing protein [Microcystis aeruginosa W11-03]NCR94654.1 DUF3747 domain-containing protein [Microcystis aeruginosa W11-06]TRU94658.1 MAG: DUF3747 domain-containing protein [Microcystis wesenbergii Mw_QC_S_20081001_S30D]TRU98944.1 MAG: DUF3747 domain-containing protein [Microcystis wesenbergii Mw_QC_B_20070930_S4D]TRV01253.1 MAG: DUF3747 domain-containing protein [Microcystis wesenbergii Mw_QC_S_20081001_S30]TRV11451.1 MAG: DUF3747 domain-containing protein [Microcystis we
MNLKSSLKFTLLFSLLGGCLLTTPSQATLFEQREVNQEDFIAIARPYGNGKYDLLILQQIPGKRQCWAVNGTEPTIVQPLLLDFDFTGSCERATDSNGYSLRIQGKDYGLEYLLRIVQRNGELVLVGTPRNPRQSEVIIGRTKGLGTGLMQIYLIDGWRFTKRSLAGQNLSHIYLTADSPSFNPPPELLAGTQSSIPPTPPPRESVKAETPVNPSANPEVREYTFTAAETAVESNPQPVVNNRVPESNFTPQTPVTPNLPPLTPPNSQNNNAIVPPPPPRNLGNQRSLSDVITFNRPAANPSSGNMSNTGRKGFKVVIEAKTDSDRSKVRSLYPDAFPTSYKGRSVWQIGAFSSRDKAENALQSLAPLRGSIVPF